MRHPTPGGETSASLRRGKFEQIYYGWRPLYNGSESIIPDVSAFLSGDCSPIDHLPQIAHSRRPPGAAADARKGHAPSVR
jgi:hypothetical protein